MYLTLEPDRETDGRYTDGRDIAGVPDLPGVLAYGASEREAVARAQALAVRVLADRLEHGEPARDLLPLDSRAAAPDRVVHQAREWVAQDARARGCNEALPLSSTPRRAGAPAVSTVHVP